MNQFMLAHECQLQSYLEDAGKTAISRRTHKKVIKNFLFVGNLVDHGYSRNTVKANFENVFFVH